MVSSLVRASVKALAVTAGVVPEVNKIEEQAKADGVTDFVTGKRRWAHGPNGDPEPNSDAVLYWFETKRDGKGGAEIIPHEIDRTSGVGTQVTATDVNGDGKSDVVVANKNGVFVFLQNSAK
jgi:hypothetical protein